MPAVKSTRDFFAHRWRGPYGGESTGGGARGLASPTWCTPWLCHCKQGGFPSCFPLQSQAVLEMSPHLRSWQPDRICRHYFPRSQRGLYGHTTALARTNLRQPPAVSWSWLTAEHQRPSATWDKAQWVTVKPAGSGTPTRKTSDCVFLQKATKGYVQQKFDSALWYMLQGPGDFTLM